MGYALVGIISLGVGILIGFLVRRVSDQLEEIIVTVSEIYDKSTKQPATPSSPTKPSTLVDLDDPDYQVEMIRQEHEQRMRRLNR